MANFYATYAGIFGGGGGGGGGGGVGTEIQESPSGLVNSINVTFVLSQTPTSAASVKLYLDGGIQYQGGGLDYTIAGATITMAAAPVSPQTLYADYTY